MLRSVSFNAIPQHVRFASTGKLPENNKMLKIAESFFNMPETVGPYFEKNWTKSPSALKRFIGKPLNWFAGKLAFQEYENLFAVKGLGRVGVIPPLGAVATIVIGFTFVSRAVFAMRRATAGDYRELGDVFRRDLPTLTILVFMMDPLIDRKSVV